MSYSLLKQTRDILVASADLSNYVSSNNIRVGWIEAATSFPLIAITTIGESDVGYLGYGTAPDGQKLHEINISFQIDILSRKSVKEATEIADIVTKELMANGYSKTSEVDTWEVALKAHRKILRFSYVYVFER